MTEETIRCVHWSFVTDKTREWANDPELMRLLNRAPADFHSEHQQWFASLKKRKDCVYFAIETKAHSSTGNIWLWNIDLRHVTLNCGS